MNFDGKCVCSELIVADVADVVAEWIEWSVGVGDAARRQRADPAPATETSAGSRRTRRSHGSVVRSPHVPFPQVGRVRPLSLRRRRSRTFDRNAHLSNLSIPATFFNNQSINK